MSTKSESVVDFIANLLPLYDGIEHGGVWCARSLVDGTVILPVDESDSDEEAGRVRVRWQGDEKREQEVRGDMFASVALERYVRLHGVGYPEEDIAGELWFMARHFHVKTGCRAYLPQLREPPSAAVRAARQATAMGKGILVNLFSKALGA